MQIKGFRSVKNFGRYIRFALLIAYCLLFIVTLAQTPLRQKIAVFTPLYIDSAFDGSNYRYDKTFPKFLNPGVEFYQGVQWALDSLEKKGAPLEVFIYDSRSEKIPLAQRLNSTELSDVQMFIAHGTSTDVRVLAA